VSSIVPQGYPLVTDGNGATLWQNLNSESIVADNLNIANSTIAASTFISVLSVGTISYPSGDFTNLFTNKTVAEFLQANSGSANTLSLGTLITDTFHTSTANLTQFFTSTLLADELYAKAAEFNQVNMDIAIVTNYFANKLNVSTITSENFYSQNYNGNELNATDLTVNRSTIANAISTTRLSTFQITADQYSTLNLTISSINGAAYPFAGATIGTQVNTDTTDIKFSTIASTVYTNVINTRATSANEALLSTFQTRYTSTGTLETKSLNAQLTFNSTISTANIYTDYSALSSATFASVNTSSLFFNTLETSSFNLQSLSSSHFKAISTAFEKARLDDLTTYALEAQKVTVDVLKTPAVNISTFYANTISSLQTQTHSISTSLAYVGTYKTDTLLAKEISSQQIYANEVSTATLQAYDISTIYTQTSSQNVQILYTSSIVSQEYQSGDATISTLTVSGPITTSTILLKEGSIQTLNTDYLSSAYTTASTLTTSVIASESLSSQQIDAYKLSTSSLTADYISTSSLQTNEMYGISASISSLQTFILQASSFVTNTLLTNDLQFVSATTDLLQVNTLNTSELSSIFFSTNILLLSTLATDFVSTTLLNISSGTVSSLYQPNITSQFLETGQGTLSTLLVQDTLQSSSSYIDSLSTTQIISETMQVDELFISTINGATYPPIFGVNPNLVTKSLTVADFVSSVSTFANNISTANLLVSSGEIGTLNTNLLSTSFASIKAAEISSLTANQISTKTVFSDTFYVSSMDLLHLSAGTILADTAFFSTLAGNSVSTYSVYAPSTTVNTILSANSASTFQLFTNAAKLNAATISSISAAIVFGNYSMDSIITDSISTVGLEGQLGSSKNLYASLVSTPLITTDTLQGQILNTSSVNASQSYIDNATVNSIIANTISTSALTADSVLTNSTATYFISSGIINADSLIVSDTAYVNTATVNSYNTFLTSLQTLSQVSTITALETSVTAATIGSTFTSSIVSGQANLTANSLDTSSLYANYISTSILGSADTLTSVYLSTNYISSAFKIGNNTTVSIVNTDYLSAGSLYTDFLSTAELNVEYLSTNRFDSASISTKNVYIADIYAPSTIVNFISSQHIDTYYISTYTATVWGMNTLIVQGSSIFTGVFDPEQGFSVLRVEDLAVTTLNVGSQTPANQILVPYLNADLVSSGITTNRLLTTSTIRTETISSSQILAPTSILNLRHMFADSISSPLISTGHFEGSSLTGEAIYGIQSIEFVSSISTSTFETGSAYLTSVQAQSISTNSITALTGIYTTLSTNQISTSAIEAGKFVLNTLSTNQFTACNINGLQLIGSALSTNHISTGSLFTSSLFGKQFATNLISATTISQNFLRFTVDGEGKLIVSNISSGLVEGVRASGQGISSIQTSATVVRASFLEANAISTQMISTSSYEQDTATLRNLYTSSLSTNFFGSPDSRWNISTLYVGSVAGNRIDGRYAEIQSILTEEVVGTVNSASGLMQSLSTTLFSAGILSVNTVFTNNVSTNLLSTSQIEGIQYNVRSTFVNFLSTANVSTSRLFTDSMSTALLSSQTSRFQELVGGNWNIQFISAAQLVTNSINTSTLSTSIISTGSFTANFLNISSFTVNSLSTSFIYGSTAVFGPLTANNVSTGNSVTSDNLDSQNISASIISTNIARILSPIAVSSLIPYDLNATSFLGGSTIAIGLQTNYLSTASLSNITTNSYNFQNTFFNFSTLEVSSLNITSISSVNKSITNYVAQNVSSLTSFLSLSTIASSFNITFLSTPTFEVYAQPISTIILSSTRELYATTASFSNVLNRNLLNVYSGFTNSTIAISTATRTLYDSFVNLSTPLSVASTIFVSSFSSNITSKNQLFNFSISTNTYYSSNVQGNFIYMSSLNYSTMNVEGSIDISINTKLSYFTVAGTCNVTAANRIRYTRDGGQIFYNVGGATFSGWGGRSAYNGQYWVIVGSNSTALGTIKRSTNGIFWENNTSGGFSSQGHDVTWGNNLWVAVGRDANSLNTIQRSTDGLNWTSAVSGGFSTAGTVIYNSGGIGITYANGLFVAVGSNSTKVGIIQISRNGSNWSNTDSTNLSGTNTLKVVKYANDIFVAGGTANTLIGPAGTNENSLDTLKYSTNGSNWFTATNTGFYGNNSVNGCRDLTYSSQLNKWVAVGAGYGGGARCILNSTDGINWSNATNATNIGGINPALAITWSGSNYIVSSGLATTLTYYSTDGNNWTNTTITDNAVILGFGNQTNLIPQNSPILVQIGNNFTGAGPTFARANGSSNVRYSEDNGVTWTTSSVPDFNDIPLCLAYNGDYWLMGGCNGGGTSTGPNRTIKRSTDGKYWVNTSNTEFEVACMALAYGNNLWVAVGVVTATQGTLATIKYSTNGWNWNNITGTTGFLTANDYFARYSSVSYANGVWIAGGRCNTVTDGAQVLRSTNGIHWTKATTPNTALTGNIQGLAYGNGVWAGISGISSIYSVDNGLNWNRANHAFVDAGVAQTGGFEIIYSQKQNRFIAGGSTGAANTESRFIYSSDAINWTSATGAAFSNPFRGGITETTTGFIAANYNSNWDKGDFMYSTDGIFWTKSNDYSFNTFATRKIVEGIQITDSPDYSILDGNITKWNVSKRNFIENAYINQEQNINQLIIYSNVISINNTLNINPSTNQVLINSFGTSTFTLDVSGQLNLNSELADLVGATQWTGTSDRRVKTQIVPANLELCKKNLQRIPLVHYKFREDLYPADAIQDKHMLGFLAQDVETVFPSAITKRSAYGFEDFRFLDATQILVNQYGVTQYAISNYESQQKSIETLSTFMTYNLNSIQPPSLELQSSFTNYNLIINNYSTSIYNNATSSIASLLSTTDSLLSDMDSLLHSS
jgi:hypothetical protein